MNIALSTHFSEEELALAQKAPLPRHIAIIMDGNRRWAKRHFLKNRNPLGGHWVGADVLATLVEAASDLGIKVLTVYAFSTENWERSTLEVNTLLNILETSLNKQRPKMIQQGVRFHIIGDITPFPPSLKKSIQMSLSDTEKGDQIDFVVALNYGGRDEIRRGIQKMIQEVLEGKLSKESISEETVSQHLDTAPFGDPDLLIRTSGEERISNFLLWQLAYTELYVTETLWPDFTPRDLLKAVLDFQKRQRRRGK